MARSVVVLGLLLAVLAGAPAARADEHDRAIVDKVDVRPSPIHGLARVRALVSATAMQGDRIPQDGKPILTVKIGGAKVPFVMGFAALAEVELSIVLVVSTTDAYGESLDRIREAIEAELFAPLEKLGASRVRMAVIGYGERTLGQKSVGTVAAARKALASLMPDETTTAVALAQAIAEATATATKSKVKVAGAMQRPVIIVVSDGDGIAKEQRPKITAVAQAAAKKGVRIHTLGFSPTSARRPLLNLGELSKQSGGTFRWVQTPEGFPAALRQLIDELQRQYVVTALAPIDEVSGKKLAVAIDRGGSPVEAEPVKLPAPKCARETCDADQYCVRGECVRHSRRPSGGPLRWILIGLGGVLGLGALGLGARTVSQRRGSRPPRPAPLPAAVVTAPGPAPAPAPMAPPGGPVLIIMSGPEAGRQVPLHHGFTLGKAPGSHFSLAHDGTASTNHAQITFDGSAWTLTDLGSTNGTFANGNRVTSVRLFAGMTLRLGSTDLRFWQA